MILFPAPNGRVMRVHSHYSPGLQVAQACTLTLFPRPTGGSGVNSHTIPQAYRWLRRVYSHYSPGLQVAQACILTLFPGPTGASGVYTHTIPQAYRRLRRVNSHYFLSIQGLKRLYLHYCLVRRRFRGQLIEVFKYLNRYNNVNPICLFDYDRTEIMEKINTEAIQYISSTAFFPHQHNNNLEWTTL